MKKGTVYSQFDIAHLAPAILTIILSMPVSDFARAQSIGGISDSTSLVLEKYHSKARYILSIGDAASFRTLSDKSFKKGRITAITDSTISISDKKLGSTTIELKNISTILIRNQTWVDVQTLWIDYNLKKVKIKLKSGKKVKGALAGVLKDSLIMKGHPKQRIVRIGYPEIESIKIHRYGSGGTSALIFGLAGAGIGALIGLSAPEGGELGGREFAVGAGAIAGFIIAAPIGAAIKAFDKKQMIQGDQEKFHSFAERLSKKLWTMKTATSANKKAH